MPVYEPLQRDVFLTRARPLFDPHFDPFDHCLTSVRPDPHAREGSRNRDSRSERKRGRGRNGEEERQGREGGREAGNGRGKSGRGWTKGNK